MTLHYCFILRPKQKLNVAKNNENYYLLGITYYVPTHNKSFRLFDLVVFNIYHTNTDYLVISNCLIAMYKR